MNVDSQMLITAERDGYFGLRAKPVLGLCVPALACRVKILRAVNADEFPAYEFSHSRFSQA